MIEVIQLNGASAVNTNITVGAFKNIDSSGTNNFLDYPVQVGERSYQQIYKLYISGTFNRIENIRMYIDGEVKDSNNRETIDVYLETNPSYIFSPTSYLTSLAPTSVLSLANITIGGSTALSSSTSGEGCFLNNEAGYTDYIYVQEAAGTNAAIGLNEVNWIIDYDIS